MAGFGTLVAMTISGAAGYILAKLMGDSHKKDGKYARPSNSSHSSSPHDVDKDNIRRESNGVKTKNVFYLNSIQSLFASFDVNTSSSSAISTLIDRADHSFYKVFLEQVISHLSSIKELYEFVDTYSVNPVQIICDNVKEGPCLPIEDIRSVILSKEGTYNDSLSVVENLTILLNQKQKNAVVKFRTKFSSKIKQILSLEKNGIDSSAAFSSLLTDIRMEHTLNKY